MNYHIKKHIDRTFLLNKQNLNSIVWFKFDTPQKVSKKQSYLTLICLILSIYGIKQLFIKYKLARKIVAILLDVSQDILTSNFF